MLQWNRIETYNIDWSKDTVFGHLIHPMTRHINGIVQILYHHKLGHLLESDEFITLLRTSIFFDQHTYPITRMFDLPQCYQIEWLLLDHNQTTGEEFTQAFLKNHGININIDDIPKFNQSNNLKKSLQEKIILHKDITMDSLIFVLQEDLNLYNQVVIHTKFFNISTHPWHEISYKHNFVEKYGFDELKKTRFNLQQ
jgi:hypothetical protein